MINYGKCLYYEDITMKLPWAIGQYKNYNNSNCGVFYPHLFWYQENVESSGEFTGPWKCGALYYGFVGILS